jgi:hypothetical protein
MVWDMSQAYANTGFLDSVSADLGLPASVGGGTTTATTKSSTTAKAATTFTTVTTTATTTSSGATSTASLVSQWNQCAGEGWTGGTVCEPPYVCTEVSVWYSQCE